MNIEEHVSLAAHTSFGVGGSARFFAVAESVEDVREALEFAQKRSVPVYILGGGNNTLFTDKGWSGLVLHPHILGKDYTEGAQGNARVHVGAGEDWDAFVEGAVLQGFWGLENLSYIPGSVGAAPVQNIGAYGVSMEDVTEHVEVLDVETGELHIFTPKDCQFAYRDSLFKHPEGEKYLITRVTCVLGVGGAPNVSYTEQKRSGGYKDLLQYFPDGVENATPKDVRSALQEIRSSKLPDPNKIGTAGSFFKNPTISITHLASLTKWLKQEVLSFPVDEEHVKIPAGWLLEVLGFRGYRSGNVGTWQNHALAVVNYGSNNAQEVLDFVYFLQEEVRKKTSIHLEPEVRIVEG